MGLFQNAIAREQPPSKVRKSRENPALSDFHDFFVGLIFRKCYFETAPIFSLLSFIDFSVDGYTRTNRKKASCNLRDTDHAKERYQELVDLVRFGKSKLNIFK